MDTRTFTIREMAEEANIKFKMDLKETDFESLIKKIRREVNDRGVKSEDTKVVKKSVAKLYSEIIKDKLLNDWVFDYCLERSNHERVEKVKPNSYYEKKIEESEVAERTYHESLTNEDYEKMYKSEIYNDKGPFFNKLEFNNKKMEIMLEAMFNMYFKLDEKRLYSDLMNDYLTNYDIDMTADILRSLDALKDNSNYYTEK